MGPVLARTIVVLCASAALASCGGDDGELLGITRSEPLVVGEASVTEVTGGMDPAPFRFVAEPGELLVVYFGYTNCPDLCPTTLAALRSATRELGADGERVSVAMVTVDPERDTADVLDPYLASFSERYHALVPSGEDELRAAESAFLVSSSVTRRSDGTVQVDHTANAFVVDDAGLVKVEWPFGHAADGMAHDLTVLFEEMG